MAEGNKKPTLSERWSGLKSEFAKIVWPDGSTIGRQTAAVIIISVIVALLIVVFDTVIQYGMDFLVNL